MRLDVVSSAWRILVGGVALAGLGACSGAAVDTNVRLPAAERPDVSPSAISKAIEVPVEAAFNYPRFSSGQEGAEARGSAVADGKAGAKCFAEVDGKGKAWGAFQLGYAFDHQSATKSHCVVRVRLTADESATAEWPKQATNGGSVDGSVNLIFFMKDSMGLTLKEESLVSSTLQKGPQTATTHHDFVFDTDLEPERGYYLVVSGRVDASSGEGTSSRVELNVSDVSMEIRWGDAAAANVQTAAQGR